MNTGTIPEGAFLPGLDHFYLGYAKVGQLHESENYKDPHIAHAITLFDEEIRQDSANVAAYHYRGKARNVQNRFEEALQDLEYAISLDPKRANIYYDLGHTLGHLNRDRDSYNALGVLVMLDPDFIGAYLSLAQGYSSFRVPSGVR